ncbi:Hint domain-containing protein [Thalassorhabdomicrobium marinisediminis]|uniref:Hedgehog/Intein (Hint) domain-containing protein n=1 Tax=Thalassorhabdomicrobium marinisediminis TaxID=2170577 RepID=A0A2T7FVS1_9RHOB|nr:Hint domain-containing protein [Thalassorhabdomicrobium marinisediminis]PVA06254.1 hypothetical protein DC363_10090 [Thalassorhabdomicrobium marinisediminis]
MARTTPTWIATRTPERCVFNPAGLDAGHSTAPVGADLLPRGSLLLEVVTGPADHPRNLLRYVVRDPWPAGLTLCLEPDGTLRLMMRQGNRHLSVALQTTLGRTEQTVHITYVWDAPARTGRLSAYLPDFGLLWQTGVADPFPLSLRDAARMMARADACAMDSGVTFAALADTPCPIGPLPGLSGDAAVETPGGPRPLRDIVAGDLVSVHRGPPMPVLWAGCAQVPALGRFAPLTLRQPYLSLRDDLVAAGDQRVCLSGSDVEYLFGEERVSTAIRHFDLRKCVMPVRPAPAVVTYHQILLASHEIITVNGAKVESFDASAVLSPDLLATSVLADMPADRCPRDIGLAAPVLQGFEAHTLTGVAIG